MVSTTKMKLSADLSHIHTDYLWRAKESWIGYRFSGSADMYEDCARIASRGRFDMLFFGDSANTSENHGSSHHAAVEYGMRWPRQEMSPFIPLMARAAPGVGFGMTMSTTYQQPFHVARIFNALDHVTDGRIAWNAVTSAYKNEAANWGFDSMMNHDERYEKAREHLEVVCKLWDSVEKDAILLDKAAGRFADPLKVHLINHRGKFFKVRGPLPALPSPQGRPIMIQAGQSGPGMDLAATYADMQFVSRTKISSMKEHRAELDRLLIEKGRSPRDLGVFWSVRVQVGDSVAHALDSERRYIETIPKESGVIELSHMFGLDFSRFSSDMKLSQVAKQVKDQNVHWGSFEEFLKANDPDMTIGELGRRNAIGKALVVRGNAKDICDQLEELHAETGQNGGFILAKGLSVPGYLREFVEVVVPELQRRNLVSREYAGKTLRENLNE